MKRKISTLILVSMILVSVIGIFKINIPEVKANPGPPYELVKNPYLNDPAYWSAEVAWGLEPESYSIINSTGWWSYAKKQNPIHRWEFAKWYNPYGCTYALQGLYPPNHADAEAGNTPAVKGQGMNYYVYIPADISDGQIICNVTVKRLKDPQAYGTDVLVGGGWLGALNFAAEDFIFDAIFHRTNIGIYFFLALRVRFWDDSYVPEHLRGKETYLGWMTPREADEFYGNGPHAGHIEFWTDTRIALPTNPNNWMPASIESGFPTITGNPTWDRNLIDYPAFIGSTQDWDFHNSRTFNVTELNQFETITVDVGKQFRELVQWWDSAKYHVWDPWVGRFLGFFGLAGRSFPSLERLCYDIVGATLIGVGPTMELIQADMACHFNWVQIYDYRDNNGEPVTDPLFWECIENWKWLHKIGAHDPWQEFWRNAVLPEQTIAYRNIFLSSTQIWNYSNPVREGGHFNIADVFENRYNFTIIPSTIANWGRAGANYTFLFSADNFEWDYGEISKNLKFLIHLYWDYKGSQGLWSNSGLYLDYEWGKISSGKYRVIEQGECVLKDYIDTGGGWNHSYFKVEKSYEIQKSSDVYVLKLMPHIEVWWTSLWAKGIMVVQCETQSSEYLPFPISLSVNNPNLGWVKPALSINNPNFELGSVFPWEVVTNGTGSFTLDSAVKYEGSYSSKLTSTNSETYAVQYILERFYDYTKTTYYHLKELTLFIRLDSLEIESRVGLMLKMVGSIFDGPFGSHPDPDETRIYYLFSGFYRNQTGYYIECSSFAEINGKLNLHESRCKTFSLMLGNWYKITVKYWKSIAAVHAEIWVDDVSQFTAVGLAYSWFNAIEEFRLYALGSVTAYFDSVDVPALPQAMLPYGFQLTLEAQATTGAYFSNWNIKNEICGVDINCTNNPLSWTVDMDYNITAYFVSSPPPSSPYCTLQISKSYAGLWCWFDMPAFPAISVNGTIIENGTLICLRNSYIQLSAEIPEGFRFWNWKTNDGHIYWHSNYNFTLTDDRTFTARWIPPSFELTVKDDIGRILNEFRVYDSYSGMQRILYSGDWCAFSYNTRTIVVSKKGYYSYSFVIKPDGTNYPNNKITVTLRTKTFTTSATGGATYSARLMSKEFRYTFLVLNASQTSYDCFNGMIKVYPILNSKVELTFIIHYEVTYPIIEIYAENIGMLKFNTSDLYHKLGCKYFDRVKSLTGFFGLSVNTTNPLILDFQLPWKPGSIWKMTPELNLPGTRLTNWQWINNRILLTLEPGDPEISFLVQSYMEQTQDIVWQFMMVILTLVMLFVALKFIRDKS